MHARLGAFCGQGLPWTQRSSASRLSKSVQLNQRHRCRTVPIACASSASPVPTPSTSKSSTAPAKLPRVLSGVQPSGNLHLGNYLGAVRGWVSRQETAENYFAVVDLHAVTAGKTPGLAKSSMAAAAMYLACGIDPTRSAVFVQSHVTAHAELCWMLGCVTPHGWLNRMIQFKEKSKRQGESASMGLFSYPVLQAADVLLYNPDVVPVGEDQRQHIELARNIAKRYNDIYCSHRDRKTFNVPESRIVEDLARIMSLEDATTKMSKSAENEGSRINLTDPPDVIRRKIKRCKTDSERGLEFGNPDRPECNNLLTIYQAVTGKSKDDVSAECAEMNWGQFKPLLGDAIEAHICPIRTRYEELLKDKAYVADVLIDGYERANQQATRTLDRVKKDMGFLKLSELRKMQK